MQTRQTDSELVSRLSTGDEEAFCELYVRYWRKVRNFILRFVKSCDLAENYAQDIFLGIWENREFLDPAKAFSAYLFRVARNKSINYLKHLARSEALRRKVLSNSSPDYRSGVGEMLLEKDYFAILQNAIRRLPPRQRQVFHLSRDNSMTHKEIAEMLGLSVYTVQEYMSDSLKSIKRYVSKQSGIIFPGSVIILNILGYDI